MFLDGRKEVILRAIIDDYIDTAEPIGSRTIAKKHELGLSSATIRNEMADLEEMGYLAQPHTSAGRVPSNKGYRLYVDRLMETRGLTPEEMEEINSLMEIKISELNQLIKQASLIVSRVTKYTSMAMTPQIKKSTLKAVQVVPIESGKALVIVVTNAGVVKNSLVEIPYAVLPDYLIRISNMLNEKLYGLSLDQINLSFVNEVETEIGLSREILMPVLNGVADCIHRVDSTEIILDGATNILNHPEFRDVEKAKELFNIFDEKEVLCKLLESVTHEKKGINVRIGNENEIEEIKNCSLVTASYSIGDTLVGSIGVIGPTRMEYARVISLMDFIRKRINAELAKIFGGKVEDETP